jgi:hypothetical protein
MIEIKLYCSDNSILDSLAAFVDVSRYPEYVLIQTRSPDNVSWVRKLVDQINSRHAAQIRLDVLDMSC